MICPDRNFDRTSLASRNGNTVVWVLMPACAATLKNSIPSLRVRLATESSCRSSQRFVGKGRNIRHVNAGADHAPALAHRAQCQRDQRTDRRVNDGSVERHRRLVFRCPGPIRAERFRQALRLDIARARKRVDRASLPAGHLRNDMAGGAETKMPRCFPSPAMTSERQPIRPAQSKGAMATSSPASPSGKQ